MFARAVLVGVLTCVAGAASSAGAGSCPSGMVEYQAPDQRHAELVCAAGDAAIESLGRCGLQPSRPVRVSVVDELPEECPTHALAFFDAARDTAFVPTLRTCSRLVGPQGRFGLAMSADLYQSLLVHEVVHAALVHQDSQRALNHTEHEYVAYAIQLSLMPPAMYKQVLKAYPHAPPVGVRELSASYFDFSPPDFAVKAYLHFSQPGNGCDFIQSLLRQAATLPGQR